MPKTISSFPDEALRVRINELEKILEEKEEQVVEYLARIEQLENYTKQLQNKVDDKQQVVIRTPSEDNLSNTERILNILKSEALTSKELAKRLNLSGPDTRTYLLRLKNDNKVRVIQKIGRYNVYTYQKPFDSEKSHTYANALEYDLSYLVNLMEMKMTLKEGAELSQSDLLTINRIKFRITQTKEDITKGMEALKEFADVEHQFNDDIKAKITELETKINNIKRNTSIETLNLEEDQHLLKPSDFFETEKGVNEKNKMNKNKNKSTKTSFL